MQRGRESRGFTLIELMIVVVIVAILSTMAVVGYRKMVAESHSSEAISVINSIRVAQEAYHAETGQYDNISATLCTDPKCTSLYPQAFGTRPTPANHTDATFLVGNYKMGWGVSCSATSECGAWLSFPVHNPGSVMYGYSTQAGIAGSTLPTVTLNSVQLTWPASSASQDWFLITAVGDVDDNGVASVYLGTSFNSDILSQNEGE